MQTVKGSYHNLAALAEGGPPSANPASTPSPSSDGGLRGRGSLQSRFNADASGSSRCGALGAHVSMRHAKKAMQSHASAAPHPPPVQLAARRVIIVSNHLPLRTKRCAAGWEFEWDEDALVAQAKVRHLGSAAPPERFLCLRLQLCLPAGRGEFC